MRLRLEQSCLRVEHTGRRSFLPVAPASTPLLPISGLVSLLWVPQKSQDPAAVCPQGLRRGGRPKYRTNGETRVDWIMMKATDIWRTRGPVEPRTRRTEMETESFHLTAGLNSWCLANRKWTYELKHTYTIMCLSKLGENVTSAPLESIDSDLWKDWAIKGIRNLSVIFSSHRNCKPILVNYI